MVPKKQSNIWIRWCHNRPFSLGQFVVPLQTTWYSLENCSFIHLKIIYSYARDYLKIWKEEFSRVSSHGLKWGNKPPSRKRSIGTITLLHEKMKEIYRLEVWIFCKMHHRISFFLALLLSVRQFQLPIKVLRFVRIINATDSLVQNIASKLCLHWFIFDVLS